VQLFYSKIPKAGVYTDLLMYRFPNGVFIHLEVMLTPFSLPDIYNRVV
jgi:hypothetical protein